MIDLTLEQNILSALEDQLKKEGKSIHYAETFVSPFQQDTLSDAKRTLIQIREAHPANFGWIEKRAFVEQLSNGKWRAVRVHVQYK